MLRTALIVALLALPLLGGSLAEDPPGCPTPSGPAAEGAFVSVNSFIVSNDGRVFRDDNRHAGLQRNGGSCMTNNVLVTWAPDSRLL